MIKSLLSASTEHRARGVVPGPAGPWSRLERSSVATAAPAHAQLPALQESLLLPSDLARSASFRIVAGYSRVASAEKLELPS